MSRKYGSLLSDFLEAVGQATGYFEWPIEGTETWRRKQLYQPRRKYYNVVWQAKKRGLVKQVRKGNKKYLMLTSEGIFQTLVSKMGIEKQQRWDGKWRVLIFDIPEDFHLKRDQLRWLLKKHGFTKLQSSVFASPYSLNREAIAYLKQTGIIDYIRILRVEEMDSDLDLRKKFGL